MWAEQKKRNTKRSRRPPSETSFESRVAYWDRWPFAQVKEFQSSDYFLQVSSLLRGGSWRRTAMATGLLRLYAGSGVVDCGERYHSMALWIGPGKQVTVHHLLSLHPSIHPFQSIWPLIHPPCQMKRRLTWGAYWSPIAAGCLTESYCRFPPHLLLFWQAACGCTWAWLVQREQVGPSRHDIEGVHEWLLI